MNDVVAVQASPSYLGGGVFYWDDERLEGYVFAALAIARI